MLKVCTLASGSKGNATYISSGTTNILVDCGLSCKELEQRLVSIGVSPSNIDAIVLTHEHYDHISGVDNFVKKHGCEIFVHQKAFHAFEHKLARATMMNVQVFSDVEFNIEDILVNSIEVSHDSKFCFGYTFTNNGTRAAVLTDIGTINMGIVKMLKGCQLVVIESNHCETMLRNNDIYPLRLKKRILSPKGHLSNNTCAMAVYELAKMEVTQIVLAHLSEQNNTPSHAYNTVKEFLQSKGVIEGLHIAVDVALQDSVGTVFELE